ncbi:hypothetical protein CIRG_00404 [Coccidioides immitis RMSCC 2394]|uniref:Uncharacterized protein n=1 Tax=Coccidioides immitis RMSCC 2394 TaxID=404692 RepID=A0A0J7ASM0_COCIT|nr:hypothetical protein CIRG_00404 [Coccidioides immitis RMSCC 2394]
MFRLSTDSPIPITRNDIAIDLEELYSRAQKTIEYPYQPLTDKSLPPIGCTLYTYTHADFDSQNEGLGQNASCSISSHTRTPKAAEELTWRIKHCYQPERNRFPRKALECCLNPFNIPSQATVPVEFSEQVSLYNAVDYQRSKSISARTNSVGLSQHADRMYQDGGSSALSLGLPSKADKHYPIQQGVEATGVREVGVCLETMQMGVAALANNQIEIIDFSLLPRPLQSPNRPHPRMRCAKTKIPAAAVDHSWRAVSPLKSREGFFEVPPQSTLNNLNWQKAWGFDDRRFSDEVRGFATGDLWMEYERSSNVHCLLKHLSIPCHTTIGCAIRISKAAGLELRRADLVEVCALPVFKLANRSIDGRICQL